ncbi:hypothetical protein KIN34_08150 [Cellulomonas sp. DKR-3]|uniref:Uncharacterized protein n=1 Tax=Cellulomonas fulva TaxID=2835530 RepID=A0ABS5TYT5_9CELL|nr:hypothetical protein [Cellulomonas fulva]MBT0994257.1 hypothetical protein [Cellulomonas fulva]
MDREKAAELAKTLDAAPDLAVDDAMDLRKLTTPLEEISERLGAMSGELGVSGKVAEAADEKILEIVRKLKAHADVVVDAAGVAQSAAGIVSRAQTEYQQLPSGQLSSWERREYEEAGAGPGITYIEQARAQQRENEADKALTSMSNDLNDLQARMLSLNERVEEYRVPEDDPATPGGRTPSTIPSVPGPNGSTPPPGGGVPPIGSVPPPSGNYQPPDVGGPTDPPYPGYPDPTDPGYPDPTDPGYPDPTDPGYPDPTDPGYPDPTDPGYPDPTDPGYPDPGDGPGGSDPTYPGDGTTPPWQYGGGDVHSDGPGAGTPYGPGPIGGPNPNLGGGLGNGGPGQGTLPGGTAPGSGGVVGGALAGGLAVGGTALGAVGGSRLSGTAGGLGTPAGALGGGAVMAGPMGSPVGAGGAGGAGGAAGGRPGATGMVGGGAGGAGGAGSTSKKKRAGSLGYLAPELDDEESPVGRAAGMRSGSREDRPDVVASSASDDDETW